MGVNPFIYSRTCESGHYRHSEESNNIIDMTNVDDVEESDIEDSDITIEEKTHSHGDQTLRR